MNTHLMTRYLWEQRIDVNHLICLNCAVLYLSILKESFVYVLKHKPEIHGIEVTTHTLAHTYHVISYTHFKRAYFFRSLVWNFRFNPKNRGWRRCHRWGKPRSHRSEEKNFESTQYKLAGSFIILAQVIQFHIRKGYRVRIVRCAAVSSILTWRLVLCHCCRCCEPKGKLKYCYNCGTWKIPYWYAGDKISSKHCRKDFVLWDKTVKCGINERLKALRSVFNSLRRTHTQTQPLSVYEWLYQ